MTATANTYKNVANGFVLRESAKAIYVHLSNLRWDSDFDWQGWLPKSQVAEIANLHGKEKDRRFFSIPAWLVRKNELWDFVVDLPKH